MADKIKAEKITKPAKAAKNNPDIEKSGNFEANSAARNLAGLSPTEQIEILTGTGSEREKSDLLMQLQQVQGNASVQRLLASRTVQAKLSISQPEDPLEKEAEAISEAVMKPDSDQNRASGPAAGSRIQAQETEEELQTGVQRQAVPEEEEEIQAKIQRQAGPEEEEVQACIQRQAGPEEEEEIQACIQRQEEDGEEEESALQMRVQRQEEEEIQAKSDGTGTSGKLEADINAARSGGQPLPESTRNFFETRLAADFSPVNIHNDEKADSLNRRLNAEAFTTGKDIFFREGKYQPESDNGKKLLAHELTHTVQQSAVQKKPTESE